MRIAETAAPAIVPVPHLLIVEDHDRAARGLEELLRTEGFEVTRAPDGPSALLAAALTPFDLIVLDVVLPGMNGFEACKALRSREGTRTVPILMLTALDDTPSKVQAFEVGADDYLVKPVIIRELAARINTHLATRWRNAQEVRCQRLRAIGEIAAAVGHEVNNPLATAAGTLEIVLMRDDLAADIRRELAHCQDHLWRISTILNQLTEVRDATIPYVGPQRMIDLMREARP